MWNVKFDVQCYVESERADLIDTLWNVKDLLHKQRDRDVGDLIDTLWNVKSSLQLLCLRLSRFNRYIVECKMAYGRKSETLIDQEVNKTQPGSVIIREFEEVGDLTVTS